jgi:hypothetical protein
VLAKQLFYHLSHTSSPSCSVFFFWRRSLVNHLPRLTLNLNLPDISLPSSYRCEPLAPGSIMLLMFSLSLCIYFFFFWGTSAWTQDLHLEPLHQSFLC